MDKDKPPGSEKVEREKEMAETAFKPACPAGW
jgi:hypothetical protein